MPGRVRAWRPRRGRRGSGTPARPAQQMGPAILDREHWVPGRAPAGLGQDAAASPGTAHAASDPLPVTVREEGSRAPCSPPEPGPASPSAFRWPPRCPGQTRCARAGWTRRRHGWTGPRVRTRGSCPPGRWSLWRDCQGLGSAPPRHGYGYCSQGRTRLWEEGGQTDGRREKKDRVGKKQETGGRKAAHEDQEGAGRPGERMQGCPRRHPPPGASAPLPAHQPPCPPAHRPCCPQPAAP